MFWLRTNCYTKSVFAQTILHSFMGFALDEIQLKRPEEIKCVLEAVLIKTRWIGVPRREGSKTITL